MADRQMRYTITLRLFRVHEANGVFDFSNSMEQVPLWSDSLIVDIEPGPDDDSLTAHAVWNSTVPGASQTVGSITDQLPDDEGALLTFQAEGGALGASVALPASVLRSGLLGGQASLRLAVSPRPARSTASDRLNARRRQCCAASAAQARSVSSRYAVCCGSGQDDSLTTTVRAARSA